MCRALRAPHGIADRRRRLLAYAYEEPLELYPRGTQLQGRAADLLDQGRLAEVDQNRRLASSRRPRLQTLAHGGEQRRLEEQPLAKMRRAASGRAHHPCAAHTATTTPRATTTFSDLLRRCDDGTGPLRWFVRSAARRGTSARAREQSAASHAVERPGRGNIGGRGDGCSAPHAVRTTILRGGCALTRLPLPVCPRRRPRSGRAPASGMGDPRTRPPPQSSLPVLRRSCRSKWGRRSRRPSMG